MLNNVIHCQFSDHLLFFLKLIISFYSIGFVYTQRCEPPWHSLPVGSAIPVTKRMKISSHLKRDDQTPKRAHTGAGMPMAAHDRLNRRNSFQLFVSCNSELADLLAIRGMLASTCCHTFTVRRCKDKHFFWNTFLCELIFSLFFLQRAQRCATGRERGHPRH